MKSKLSLRDTVINITALGIFTSLYIEFVCIFIISLLIIKKQNLKFSFSKYLLPIFILILCASVLIASLNKYQITKTVQQFSLLIIFFSGYTIIFKFMINDIENLFNKYIRFAFFVSLIGLCQFIIYYLTGINILSFTSNTAPEIFSRIIRVSSILSEPAYLSGVLLPAIIFFIYSKQTNHDKYKIFHFIVILITLLLTFSSASYLILLIALLYKVVYKKRTAIVFILMLIMTAFAYPLINRDKVPRFSDNRVFHIFENTYSGLVTSKLEYTETLNASSYALLTNLYVALNAPSRIFGTGLGTHEQNYRSVYKSSNYLYGQNAQDGYSLLIRIFSEFGVVGIMILIVFIMKNFNKNNPINISAFFLILQFLLRGGHYTIYGTIFFFCLYYYTGRKYDYSLREKYEPATL